MKFRTGIIVGFAAGYVLGAKAGRSRYHQIQQFARKVSESGPGQRVQSTLLRSYDENLERVRSLVEETALGGLPEPEEGYTPTVVTHRPDGDATFN
jgi:hypothetical protein